MRTTGLEEKQEEEERRRRRRKRRYPRDHWRWWSE